MQRLLEDGSSIWFWLASRLDSPWLSVLVLTGAGAVALLAASRAERLGIDFRMARNQLILGLLILVAITGHGLLLWVTVQPLAITRVVSEGWLTLFGATSATAAILAITPRPRPQLPLLVCLDVVTPPVLLGQALTSGAVLLMHYGSVQASGADVKRLEQMASIASIVLPETLWHLTALALVVWIERLARGRLLAGDVALLYGIFYGVGRLLSEGPGSVLVQSVSLCIAGLCGLFLFRRHQVYSTQSALAEKH
jgi:prolipoprotein diacylglyceryltransferase